jgi:Ras GTPase-activating-like protein IQGAP2/3
LAQISKVLTQITGGSEFGEDSPSYLPINEFVRKAIAQMTAWFIEGNILCFIVGGNRSYLVSVANVPDAENQFHAHEFLDATVQPKPIYISPNEVYAMHSLLSENLDTLVHAVIPFTTTFPNWLLRLLLATMF